MIQEAAAAALSPPALVVEVDESLLSLLPGLESGLVSALPVVP
jgi:hypothetical protein